MSFKRVVVGIGMALGMLTASAEGQPPVIFLSVVDTFLYPGDMNERYLTVRMNNPSVKIGAYNVGLAIQNPQTINFAYYDVDTTLPHWLIYLDCSPPPCHLDSILECPIPVTFIKVKL